MAVEREHKFLVGTAFPESSRLREAFGKRGFELRLSAPREQSDVYYDTPALTLLAAGVALRIRRYDGEMLATYKESGVVRGSLHAREELELPYSAPWPAEILAKLAPLGVVNDLEPLVQLSAQHVRYLVYGDYGNESGSSALAELSLDDVSAAHGAQQISFKELELEAQPTLPDAAFADLAEVLRGLGLEPHSGDKLSHALTLLGLLPSS